MMTTNITKAIANKQVRNFTDLIAWQKGHEIALHVYRLTATFPVEEKFGVVSQLRRAATSTTANIAEGFGRYHYKDKVKFYLQSRGSNSEVQNFLLLVKDLGYITEEQFLQLNGGLDELRQLINGLIRSTNSRQ